MELKTREYQDLSNELIHKGWEYKTGYTYVGGDLGTIFTHPKNSSEIHFRMIVQGGLTLWEPILINGGEAKFPDNHLELWDIIRSI